MTCSSGQMMSLAPMTSQELDSYIREEIADCASSHLRDGSWSRRECHARALVELAGVAGCQREAAAIDTQRLLAAHAPDGQTVGWLWVKLPPAGPWAGSAFLCQMTVARAHRRRGYGRAMLAALESVLRAEGLTELRLNVWEENAPAKALYVSAGYTVWQRHETMRQMRKSLADPTTASVTGDSAA
jgi:ribosomal protein S18 acetylase RimI-like enzyme